MNLFTKLTLVAVMAASATVVSAQERPDLLWIAGEATPYDWDLNYATALVADKTDTKVYTGTLYLKANLDFKFMTKYDFGYTEYGAASDGASIVNGSLTLASGTIDANYYKIQVPESANYLISVDTENLEATIVKSVYQTTQVPYASLILIGSVLGTDGYSPNDGLILVQNKANPVEFSVTNVPLNAGDFKIAVAMKGPGDQETKDDNGNMVNYFNQKYFYFSDFEDPTKMVKGIDGAIEGPGAKDNKWKIAEAANYNITANIADNTISIQKNLDPAGVETVEAESLDCDTPARYYSIDGRRVIAPAAGSLVIKVAADGTVTKVRF